MSRIVALIGLVLLGAVSSGARAQTPEERGKLERLERRAAALAARRDQVDSLARVRHDTVRVGPIIVLTDSATSPLLRDALAGLRDLLADGQGTEAIPTLANALLVVRLGPPDRAWSRLIVGDAQFIQLSRHAPTAERLTAQLAHGVRQILVARGGRRLGVWRADLRPFEDPRPLLEATYIELRTSPLPGAQHCFAGDLDACAYVLRLAPDTGAARLDLVVGLPEFVERRFRWRANAPALARPFAACVGPQDAGACLEFLDLIGAEVPSASTRARGTVLLAARDLGGSEALLRFFADTGAAVVPRLEAAAGVPLDSLIGSWRATVLAHRPIAMTIPLFTQWVTIAWVLGLAAVATRSTRWR